MGNSKTTPKPNSIRVVKDEEFAGGDHGRDVVRGERGKELKAVGKYTKIAEQSPLPRKKKLEKNTTGRTARFSFS